MLTPDAKSLFFFEDGATYLNHGAVGVTPNDVFNARMQKMRDLEAAPDPFFATQSSHMWKDTAALVAARFAARPENLALVANATDGITAILRAQSLKPGDEILITNLTYGAVEMAAQRVAKQTGPKIIVAQIRFPVPDPTQCIEAITSAMTPRTRLAILDHITSTTALVMPIADMVKACRDRNVPVLVDGAHAPGHVALDIESIQADWYIGNLHKWYFVPRGCGFLWAAPHQHVYLSTNIMGWSLDRPFPTNFERTGTNDPTTWMSAPDGFAFMDKFGEGEVRQHNHALVLQGLEFLAREWGTSTNTPDDMIGNMGVVFLPRDFPCTDKGRIELQIKLWEKFKIAAAVSLSHQGQIGIRVTAQMYNEPDDYVRLARAIHTLHSPRL